MMLRNLLYVLIIARLGLLSGACLSLPVTQNIQFTCTDRFNSGSKCTHVCDRGYEMHGGPILYCRKTWSEIHPLCKKESKRKCPTISAPSNGKMLCNNDLLMGVICSFSCEKGFVLNRDAPLICNSMRQWNNPVPFCNVPPQCKEVVANNLATVSCTDKWQIGSVCTISCPLNLALVGQSSMTCIESSPGIATWNALVAQCLHTCDPPMANPANGVVSCSSANHEGSVCNFRCDSGFLVSEVNVVVTCKKSSPGWLWDRAALTCDGIPVRCSKLNESGLTVNTGYVCTKENLLGSVCTFHCLNGAKLNTGVTKMKCEDPKNTGAGNWKPPLPNCFFVSCQTPTIANGKAVCSTTKVGATCFVSCATGYAPSVLASFKCRKNGTWDGTVPDCLPAPCLPALEKLAKKSICTNANSVGSKCKVDCTYAQKAGKSEEFLCGDPSVRKGAGFWNKNLMQCVGCGRGLLDIFVLVDGSSSISPENFKEMMKWTSDVVGEIDDLIDLGASWLGLGVAGSKESFCNLKKSISTLNVEIPLTSTTVSILQKKISKLKPIGGCFHLGSSLTEAVSSLIKRRRPKFTPVILLMVSGTSFDSFSGSITMANAAGAKFVVVGFKGAQNFKFTAVTTEKQAIFNVPEAGLFSSATKLVVNALIKADCPGLSMCGGAIPNGQNTCKQFPGKRRLSEEQCTTSCNKNFALYGNSTNLCGDVDEDGIVEWLSPKPGCKMIKCPDRPQPPANGVVSCTKANKFFSHCMYYCLSGFTMLGLSESHCGDPNRDGNGEWSSKMPQCVKILLCNPVLSAPLHGSMACTGNNTFGVECRFSCDPGFEMVGSGFVTCGDVSINGDLEWSDKPPACETCKTRLCKLDLIVVLDSSASIKSRQFHELKQWVADVVGAYRGEIDAGRTWVGIIQYSGTTTFMCNFGTVNPYHRVELDLSRHTFSDVRATVTEMGHLRGCTMTGGAMVAAIKHFDVMGRKEEIIRAMIVITDGLSNDEVAASVQAAKRNSIKLVAIGIGRFDIEQLKEISESVIVVPSFDQLHSSTLEVRDEVRRQISEGFLIKASKKQNSGR